MKSQWRVPEPRSDVIQSALYEDHPTACNRVRVEARRPNKRATVIQARSAGNSGLQQQWWPKGFNSGYILKIEPVGFLKEMNLWYYEKK